MSAHEIIEAGLYSAAVNLMDDDIREELHRSGAFEVNRPDTEELFLERYMEAHERKYGVPFVI